MHRLAASEDGGETIPSERAILPFENSAEDKADCIGEQGGRGAYRLSGRLRQDIEIGKSVEWRGGLFYSGVPAGSSLSRTRGSYSDMGGIYVFCLPPSRTAHQ